MDKYDPQKRVALIVDEWGAWYDAAPDTNPGFLYQQNTVRDALLAGITLNIFNVHADRVRMANLAQTVNVLQALILTDGPRLVLTPTYHVFDMYKVHMDAVLLAVEMDAGTYTCGAASIPQVSASASRDTQGAVSLTICNLHPWESLDVRCLLAGREGSLKMTGQTLTGDAMDAHNTFDVPDRVRPTALTASGSEATASLPPMSVSLLRFSPS